MFLVSPLERIIKKLYRKNPKLFFWKPLLFISTLWWNRHWNVTFEYKKRIYDGFKPILLTPRFKCNPNAKIEVHTLISHHHLFMYITAIKSLLRFYDDIAVVAHDGDGDLAKEDYAFVKEHIKGIRIIDREFADREVQKLLHCFPSCRKYRARIVNSLELLDNILLAKTDKIITMNSDVLFLQKPEELIQWISNGMDEIIYVHEDEPATEKDFFAEVGCNFPAHVTLALVCFYKQIIDLELIENTLRRSRIAWTHLWTTGQCIYPVLFENQSNKYKIHSFNRDKNQASADFKEGAIFRHYWSSTDRFFKIHIDDTNRMIPEISGR